jgi:hypothetical protein
MYTYGILTLLTNCALEMGQNQPARLACQALLKKQDIPEEILKQASNTLEHLK